MPRCLMCLISLVCLGILAACSPLPDIETPLPHGSPSPSAISPTPSPSPSSTPAPTPAPAASPIPAAPPRSGYSLRAQFDYFNHDLSVEETITYTNQTDQPLPDLALVIEPNRWPGGFVLHSLLWQSGQPVDPYQLEGHLLSIPLTQPLQEGESIGLSLTYDLLLPEIPQPSPTLRPVPYGYTERQTNLVDWYAYLPPYRPGSGWLVHKPWYFGEYQIYDAADYQVEITLTRAVDNLLIAASAPVAQEGLVYRYQLENARGFSWSASNQYLARSETLGDVTVTSYAFPLDTAAGEAALQNTLQALKLYDEEFGPYQHRSLSVVEADFLDGMEYDGLYFLSRGFYNLYDGTPKSYLTIIAAHETAHQWWYGLVGNDQALEPWLDEALCTYSEHIFFEKLYPDLVDWWWSYRVDYYQPSGWVNGTIYDFDGFRPYRDAIYLNGAKFLDALRHLTGDEVFFSFLQDYAARKVHQQATAEDFFAILREHTSADWSGLLEDYFHP